MALILFVPISGFIVFSYDFYALWQNSLTKEELYIVTALSILTVIQAYFNSTTATMAQISVVTNQLKFPVFISLGCGIVSIIIELLLLKFTNMGLYAIAISPTIVLIIRYVVFNSMYAAWCLKQPKGLFFMTSIKTWIAIPILIGFMVLVRKMLPINSWMGLVVDAVICGVVGYLFMVLCYGKDELKMFVRKIKSRIL